MPYVRKVGNTPNTAEASSPPEQPSRFGNLRNWLGTGVRLGSGFVANAGGLAGVAAGGGGELLAELLEGSLDDSSWKRVGVEAAIGAIPLGKTLSAGRAIKSAVKGAGFNAAGDVMRQGAEGNFGESGSGWDSSRTMYAGAGGAAINGLLGKFAPGMGDLPLDEVTRLQRANEARKAAGQAPRIPGRPSISAPNVHPPIPNGNPKEFEKLQQMFERSMGSRQRQVDFEQKLSDRFDTADTRADTRHLESLDKAARNKAAQSELDELKKTLEVEEPTTVRETISAETPTGRESATRKWVTPDSEDGDIPGSGRRGTPLDPEEDIVASGATDASVAAAQARRGPLEYGSQAPDVDEMMAAGRPGPVGSGGGTFDEMVNAGQRGPLGYGNDPAMAAAQGRRGPLGLDSDPAQVAATARKSPLGSGSKSRKSPLGSGSQTPPTTALNPDEEGLTDLLNFLAVDRAYRDAGPDVRKEMGEIFGRTKAKAMASNAPSTSKVGSESGKGEMFGSGSEIPPTTALNPKDEEALMDLLNFLGVDKASKDAGLDVQKGLDKIFGRTKAKSKVGSKVGSKSRKGGMFGSGSETGAINPELMSTIAGGSIGGLVDAAWGDDSNPIEGILAGAAIGGGAAYAPKLLQSVNLSPELLQTPEGRRKAAEEIASAIPQWQRFAYLSDPRGLIPNAWFGPYGSMMTSAIEAGLAGDPRGWAVVKQFYNPLDFVRHMKENVPEAIQRLREGEMGRTEGLPFELPRRGLPQSAGEVNTAFRFGTAIPGVAMTTGDVTARRFLMKAGFSDDEARRMTMTAEPRTKAGKDTVNFGRSGSVLSNMLLPFRRTPVNIMEEGASRIPGLGTLTDYLSEKPSGPKNLLGGLMSKEQVIQQAGGAVAGTIGYQAGQEMDDPRSNWQNVGRRSLTNAAGRYSLPMMLGVMAGQTIGQDKTLTKQHREQAFEQAIPLPSVDPLVEGTSWAMDRMGLTNNKTPVQFPRSIKTGVVDFLEDTFEAKPSQPLSRYSQIRRR